jgi:hypothetical protein
MCGVLEFMPAFCFNHCLCNPHIGGEVKNRTEVGYSKNAFGKQTHFAQDKHSPMLGQ